MNNTQILLKNNFIEINSKSKKECKANSFSNELSTIVSNLAYFGYVPSLDLLAELQGLSDKELVKLWASLEPEFKVITGADKEMEKFVVYKNFPTEVLNKTESEYWTAQILMYWGVPNNYLTEDEQKRPKLKDKKSLKVLSLSNDSTLQNIFDELMKLPSRWTDVQKLDVFHLFEKVENKSIDVDVIKFKENAIEIAKKCMELVPVEDYSKIINISNATDVLRLASGMSDGDISLREKVKFKNFKRSERRFLLGLLNASNNLLDDVIARPEVFKRLLKALRPGDYSFEVVSAVYDSLYKKDYVTFQSKVTKAIEDKNDVALEDLKSRPGELFRKFHHVYGIYKEKAVNAFIQIVPSLNNLQLLKMSKYLESINERKSLMFAPKGNWTKVQIEENKKVEISNDDKSSLLSSINKELKIRLEKSIPEGVELDIKTKEIKLQTNDQELASYGRGTSFDIPENMKFIRTASYWAVKGQGYTWFDNSWNFFDKDWKALSTCCWSSYSASNKGAIFSGDPTNTKDIEGRACQMIDLYLDKLEESGVKYAVWNILSYNKMPFENADVLATLQYGEDALKGNLYEPSRAQMVFPLKGDNLTKYIAYIDVPKRKLVYMDANLYGNTSSADLNGKVLEKTMPAYIEYLDTLPSVYDLFKNAPKGDIPILYSDKKSNITTDAAFVFKKENTKNKFEDFKINELLVEKKSNTKSIDNVKKKYIK